jgi:hypothetical protein
MHIERMKMGYSSDYREAAMAAIDTSYKVEERGADTEGAFDVPTTAKILTEVRVAFGTIGSDVITGTTSAIKLSGTGLKNSGDVYFVGPMTALAGAAAKDGGFAVANPMIYKTNIALKQGEINAFGFCHGEDPGAGHIVVNLVFDGAPGRIKGGDYREETTGAAANTQVALRLRETAAAGDFSPLGRTIGEVVFGAIPDPVGHASDGLLIAPALHLSGKGLMANEPLNFVGAVGSQHPDTDISGDAIAVNPNRYVTPGIRTKSTGKIKAEAMNIESIQSIHAIVGLLYV